MIVTITGEAGGIGSGMSVAMAKEGETVAVVDIDEEAGKAMEKKLQEISPESIFIKADLINRENSPNIVEQVGKKYGKLDVLVNNAHASRQKPFEEITKEDFDLSFGTGFLCDLLSHESCFPLFERNKRKHHQLRLCRWVGRATNAKAAKEAIRAISKVAANEWGKYGITANIISPIANTPGVVAWKEAYPDMYQAVLSQIPLGR